MFLFQNILGIDVDDFIHIIDNCATNLNLD